MAGWFAVQTDALRLTPHEALSGVFGSVSLAAWIFLLLPQLVENYKRGSAEGISLAFLAIWFVGDVTNLAGALWAGLVPTVVALAVYFCLADLVLIAQCAYYNARNARRDRKRSSASAGSRGAGDGAEQSPLLGGRRGSDALGLPGSRRRRSSAASKRRRSGGGGGGGGARRDSLAQMLSAETGRAAWARNALSVAAVCVAGAAGWAAAWRSGAWHPAPAPAEDGAGGAPLGAEMLGYASAVCYLGARIPQIVKNQRDRSCEGLSLLFFLLSLLGNATYGAGILFHSTERRYFLTNLPWLIGSLGTMAEDAIIFVQFHAFGEPPPPPPAAAAE